RRYAVGVGLLGQNPQALGHRDQVGDRLGAELLEYSVAVRLDGSFRNAERVRRLLVHASPHDELKDLSFPGGQCFQKRMRVSQPLLMFPFCIVPRDRSFDALEQGMRGNRLGKEILGAGLYGFDRHRNIAVTGKKDDWKWGTDLNEPALQRGPAQAWQADIKQDASNFSPRADPGQKL